LFAIIIGYLLYIKGLIDFTSILKNEDNKAMKNVRNGAILMIAATVFSLDFIGFPGILIAIINIVGFILMLVGYSKLKNSPTFHAQARVGATKLFLAMILSLVGAILGIIPLIGGIINGILSIIAFILVLLGWNSIKNAEK
jgi:hypothetical protein